MNAPASLRCAIYTRKSSEEGLDQDFNSLHAQREACEAYILSQRSEGWKLIKTAYDDGGISGGTMERPSLRRLMADVESGMIDVIVVYKVDRLTRSLADFAKMVEVFDARKVSFVAVTQQFNTTTSMGRLTLNVLLSFAQFEREVTGERIRDKIAASKKKGIWMGGNVPLGYRREDRKLFVVPIEAEQVRTLFQTYLESSSVGELAGRLRAIGIGRRGKDGKPGTPYSRGALYKLLTNPVYIGQVSHKGQRYPGLQQGIIELSVWTAVQDKLTSQAAKTGPNRATASSPLMGKIFDESDERLKPSHAIKRGVRYRYYVSKIGDEPATQAGWRLPAVQFEKRIRSLVEEAIRDTGQLTAKALTANLPEANVAGFLRHLDSLKPDLDWVQAVYLQKTCLRLALALPQSQGRPVIVEYELALQLKRRGVEQRLVIPGLPVETTATDAPLIKAIRRAAQWWEQWRTGEVKTLGEIARREGVGETYVTNLLPLAFLAPSIVEDIRLGRQPVDLTATKLVYKARLPACWQQQKRMLGYP